MEDFVVPAAYQKMVDRILVPKGLIIDRIEKIAASMYDYYYSKGQGEMPVVMVCVLKGAMRYYNALTAAIRRIAEARQETTVPFYLEFYTTTKGFGQSDSRFEVTDEKLVALCKDKHVCVVEDLLDSGVTLSCMTEAIKKSCNAKSVTSTVLFAKRVDTWKPVDVHWVGFEVPNHFILGYGCDLNDYFRDLDHLCTISEEGKRTYL